LHTWRLQRAHADTVTHHPFADHASTMPQRRQLEQCTLGRANVQRAHARAHAGSKQGLYHTGAGGITVPRCVAKTGTQKAKNTACWYPSTVYSLGVQPRHACVEAALAHAAGASAKKKFSFCLPAAARRVHRCIAVVHIRLQQVLQTATASPLAQVKVWSPLYYMATPGTHELHSAEVTRMLAREPRSSGPTPCTGRTVPPMQAARILCHAIEQCHAMELSSGAMTLFLPGAHVAAACFGHGPVGTCHAL